MRSPRVLQYYKRYRTLQEPDLKDNLHFQRWIFAYRKSLILRLKTPTSKTITLILRPPSSSVLRSELKERTMTPKTRLTGEPIMRILCKKTDTLVGYLYQWNNGDLGV